LKIVQTVEFGLQERRAHRFPDLRKGLSLQIAIMRQAARQCVNLQLNQTRNVGPVEEHLSKLASGISLEFELLTKCSKFPESIPRFDLTCAELDSVERTTRMHPNIAIDIDIFGKPQADLTAFQMEIQIAWQIYFSVNVVQTSEP
jgi:hypothetical protein